VGHPAIGDGIEPKGRGGLFLKIGCCERTADPSTALRSGRDDKGRGVAQVGVVSGWDQRVAATCEWRARAS
jgi:hypothetical protein